MRTRKLYVFMLAVAAVLTACTNEDNFTNEQLPNTGNEARTFTVNIPASMGEGAQTRAVTFNNDATTPTATGSFAASEPVYVYNETKGVMLAGELHPTDISADGKSCNLTGELTGSFDAGDQLTLLYNMIYDDNPDYCFFDYGGQDGSESGVVDGGMATGVSATISGSTLTTDATVTFAMQQAIFRLKFTDGTNPINVKSLIIKCTGSDVASCYNPFNNEPYIYSEQSISVNPTTPTSEYLYVALGINESASPSTLTFTVTDDDGNVYTAPKAAPSSGFKNGKYYYSSAATVLTWQTKLVKPTITNITNVDYAGEFGPDPIENFYYLMPVNDENPVEITISGTSNGYWFSADGGNAIIHLNNLTATHDSNYFISTVNLTLDISGANSITCKEKAQAIQVNGTLKLSGNGTLTVTANDISRYGLYASSNYKNGNNSDASVLAAPGYAVTRSAITDNGNGTYTWTYTVRPLINLSSLTGNYTAQDGDVLTGTLASNLKLKIAAGATVTLAGMTHHAGDYINSIECLGTANIILAEGTTNDLTRGSSDAYAGLFLNNGITWSILTISGTGTLLASGGNACAGIGGINYCDDIVINGGIIYATGGQFAPGIGAGANVGQTGNITINGGNITATGGEGAAGIGAGTNSSYCKDITIENTVTSVTAIKGADANESIGHGSGVSSCGTVKFGTATMFDDSRWTTTPNSGNNYGLLHFVISTTTNTNDTWTLTPLNQGQGGLQNYNVNPATEQ